MTTDTPIAASEQAAPIVEAPTAAEAAASDATAAVDVPASGSGDKIAEDSIAPAPADTMSTPIAVTTPVVAVPPPTTEAPAVAAAVTVRVPTVVFAVDSVRGSDSNTGAIGSPWRTLARLGASALPTGAQINLECGSVWRESLVLDATRLADNITIRPNGANCATQPPRITGADDFSGGWTKAGAVWSKRIPASTPKLTQLFVNGAPMRLAQWPNAGSAPVLVAADSTLATANAVALDAATATALSGRTLDGATIHVRSRPWIAETRKVTSFSALPSRLILDQASSYLPQAGRSFVLQDKAWMLDAPGEFFHDTATSTLFLIPQDAAQQNNLNTAMVEGSVRAVNLTLMGKAGLLMSGIRSDMATTYGLQLTNLQGAVVDAITASGNGVAGIRVDHVMVDTRRMTISNSRIDGNMIHGIYSPTSTGVNVVNNTVTNTGVAPHEGPTGAAIRIGAASLAQGNLVDGAGYHGIHFAGTADTRVAANQIRNYCLRFPDCGGIYTWNGPKATRSTSNQHSLVEGNMVLSAKAATVGSTSDGADLVAGIYLDDFSQGVTVRNNVLYDMTWGIYLHNTSQSLVESNKLWGIHDTALVVKMEQTDADYATQNIFRSNQIVPISSMASAFPAVPRLKSSLAVSLYSTLKAGTSVVGAGTNQFVGNQIIMLQGQVKLPTASIRSSDGVFTSFTPVQWAPLTTGDAVSQSAGTYRVYQAQTGPSLLPTGGFDLGVPEWSTYFLPTGLGGSAVYTTDRIGCTGRCALYTSGSISDSLISPEFSMAAGKLHTIRYRAGFPSAATLRKPYIARSVSPWDSFVGSEGMTITSGMVGTANSTQQFEAYFRPTSSAPARVNLKLESTRVPVVFDDVSVHEVLGYTTALQKDWLAMAVAPVGNSTTVDCASLGWTAGCTAATVDGLPVALPTTLAAGASLLLVRTDSAWRE